MKTILLGISVVAFLASAAANGGTKTQRMTRGKARYSQKFKSGDRVQIANPLPGKMTFFPAGRTAVVVGSNVDMSWRNPYREPSGALVLYRLRQDPQIPEYELFLPDSRHLIAWYPETALKFVEHGAPLDLRKLKLAE
jgi:hypothetical protein